MTTVSTVLLAAIATRLPNITLANALGLVEDFDRFHKAASFDVTTHEGLVAFARTRSDVMDNLPDRKIQAIKNLRTAAQAVHGRTADGRSVIGLKETKDAVDAIVALDYPNRDVYGRY